MNEKLMCNLPASGFTETTKEVHDWACAVVSAARQRLSGPISAYVWAYRHGYTNILSCDLSDASDVWFPITLSEAGKHSFHVSTQDVDTLVPDLVEAIHMVGIIVRALDATVSMGRYVNEVNAAVLAQPLKPGETNGPMALAIQK